jgi:hypothetical protein
VGAVAVRRVLALSAVAESEGLTGFRIDFERRGLPAHGFIIEQSWENESANCGRWKEGGRVLPILLIPIEKDAGGGVEGQLVGLLKAAPAIFVRFFIEGDICLRCMTEVVQQNKVGRFIKLFRLNAVLDEGKTNLGEGEASFLQDFTSECIFGGFPSFNLSSRNSP